MFRKQNLLAILLCLSVFANTGLACTGYYPIDLIKTGTTIIIKILSHFKILMGLAAKPAIQLQ